MREKEAEGKEILFMHDNAPAHGSKKTTEFLKSRDIIPIKWPALSPDLNPIEYCWNWMKDYLQQTYGDRKFTATELYGKVQEAWEIVVTDEKLARLMSSMHQRCVDVIVAEGGYTRW